MPDNLIHFICIDVFVLMYVFVYVCVRVCVRAGPDVHSGHPRGVCGALLEPGAREAGGGPRPPHRADLLRARALPHRQGHLRHSHVGHAQQEGSARAGAGSQGAPAGVGIAGVRQGVDQERQEEMDLALVFIRHRKAFSHNAHSLLMHNTHGGWGSISNVSNAVRSCLLLLSSK